MTIPGSNWRAEIGTKPAGAIREGFTEEVIKVLPTVAQWFPGAQKIATPDPLAQPARRMSQEKGSLVLCKHQVL